MTIASQLKQIRDAAQAWAEPLSGSAEIARDIIHLFALLGTRPGGFVAVCAFRSEEKRGEFEEASMVDRKFWIVLSFGQSMRIDKGEALVSGAAGGKPIFELVEGLRDQVIRQLQFDPATTEVTVDYKSALPFEIPEGLLIDAYTLEFTLGSILPAPGP